MNYRTLVLLISSFHLLQSASREERLVQAIRISDAPLVRYHLRLLDRDGASKDSRKKLVEGLLVFAGKVATAVRSSTELVSKDWQPGKILAGLFCSLTGVGIGTLMIDDDRSIVGLFNIYKNWKNEDSQEIDDYYYLSTGAAVFLGGLGLIIDGTRKLLQKPESAIGALEVQSILITHYEELRS